MTDFKELVGKRVYDGRLRQYGRITEVDETIYKPSHTKEDPWIVIELEGDSEGERVSGVYSTLFSVCGWRVIHE